MPYLYPLIFALLVPSNNLTANGAALAQITATAYSTEREVGIELYRQRKFKDAAKQLRKAIDKNKNDAEAWHYLGLALLGQGKKTKDASKAFEASVKLRPEFAPAHTALSYVYLTRNKLPEAIREAQVALRIEPNNRDARYFLAAAHLREGWRDEALKDAEIVIKLDPVFAAGYLIKSQALVPFLGDALVQRVNESPESRKARFGEAAEALEKYLQLNSNAKDQQMWVEQLESLRFYAKSRDSNDTNRPYSGKEVRIKAKVLSKPEPAYTEEARSNQITGTVVLRAIFAADGKVKYIVVVSGLPDGLTEAAIRSAKRIKFIPATIDGRPVSMYIQLEYNFNLY